MKTTDYAKQLARGILRNTTLAELRNGIDKRQDEFAQVCTMVDEGLLRLYSRFVIREKHVLVEMRPGTTFYHLKPMYSVTGADPIRVPHPYIMDLPNEPFLGDVIKVLSVYDDMGDRRPLNDHSRPDGIFTPQADVLQNMYPRDLEVLGVAYQARPLSTLVANADTWKVDTEFYLPDCLLPALTCYVAYLYYQSVGTAESLSASMMHNRMYEEVCMEVDSMDLVNQSMSCTNVRFTKNGWK